MASTEQSNYWQQDDKAVMGKIFITIGAFAAIMIVVAVAIGLVL